MSLHDIEIIRYIDLNKKKQQQQQKKTTTTKKQQTNILNKQIKNRKTHQYLVYDLTVFYMIIHSSQESSRRVLLLGATIAVKSRSSGT